jgi:hypothetical protein
MRTPAPEPADSMARTTFMEAESMTCPKTTWWAFNHLLERAPAGGRGVSIAACNQSPGPVTYGVGARVMKNWDPLVSFPRLAMDRMPGPVCWSCRPESSSGKLPPGP